MLLSTNMDKTLSIDAIIGMGVVPSSIIIVGWIIAFFLFIISIYNLIKLMFVKVFNSMSK